MLSKRKKYNINKADVNFQMQNLLVTIFLPGYFTLLSYDKLVRGHLKTPVVFEVTSVSWNADFQAIHHCSNT